MNISTQENLGARTIDCAHAASISVGGAHGTQPPQMPARPLLTPGDGVEIGRFRLKPGIEDTHLRDAHRQMVDSHLSRQPGWKDQYLVSLGNGEFVDLAFASSQAHASAICASWQGQPACDAFLAMIDPESMSFGSVC